ncbi:MAG: cation diffusion facilitator family transporter [Actinomycetota bacterium]|nr:cation diffusion facilitator family transporter [Actinomycetota bacterium]
MAPSHAHHHGAGREGDLRYLSVALALIVGFMVAEVAVAALSGSLALLADAGHMLTDAGALAMSIWAARLATRPASTTMTWGFKRVEILSAALNGLTLVVVAALITFEAIRRIIHPSSVDGAALVVVAAAGVVINAAATLALRRADRSSLNIAAAFAHLVTDLWAFAATLVAGIVILATGFDRADAVASLVAVVLMVRAAWGLLRASAVILLEGTPEGVDLDVVRAHLLGLPEVASVHDLHAWVVTSDLPAISAHVVVNEACFADGLAPRVLDEMQACLAGHFDVEHSTFQLEPVGHIDHEHAPHD